MITVCITEQESGRGPIVAMKFTSDHGGELEITDLIKSTKEAAIDELCSMHRVFYDPNDERTRNNKISDMIAKDLDGWRAVAVDMKAVRFDEMSVDDFVEKWATYKGNESA